MAAYFERSTSRLVPLGFFVVFLASVIFATVLSA